jgi:hypothetical protein
MSEARAFQIWEVFWILESLHRLYQLSIPDLRSPNPKSSKIGNLLSIRLTLKPSDCRAFQTSGFQIRDVRPVTAKYGKGQPLRMGLG